jgi:hypothetical protein
VDAGTRRDLAARVALPIGFGVAVFVSLVVRNHSVLSHPIYEDGDFAGSSFLVDEAVRLRLFVGNSSKYRFNHPGPAFLYVQAVGQDVAHRWLRLLPGQFNGQLLALYALQGALIGLIARTIQRQFRSISVSVVFMTVALLMLSGRFASGSRLASSWPPWLVVAPFALALVAGASVAIGELRDLPTLVFSTGLLWHDHASFVGLAGISLAGLAVLWFVGHRHTWRAEMREYRRPIVIAAVIEAVFLLPVVLELILHFPGPWSDYISYARNPSGPGLGFSTVFHFVTDFWGVHAWIRIGLAVVAVAGIAIAQAVRVPDRRRYLLALFGAAIWATALTTAYAAHGVDRARFTYEAYWYAAAPAIAVAATAAAAASLLYGRVALRSVAAVVGVAALAFGLTGPSTLATYKGVSWLPAAVQAARVDNQRHGRTIAIRFPHAAWPGVVGLLEQANRTHVRMCLADPSWTWLVTTREICSRAGLRRDWTLYAGPFVRRPAAATHMVYGGPAFVLAVLPASSA